MGGIVGYATYADISDSDNNATNITGACYFPGGIAGAAINTSITNCDMTGTSISTSQMQSAGGIVAKLGTASVLDGCSSRVATLDLDGNGVDTINYKYGAVAGESISGSTIKSCHYPAVGSIPDIDVYDTNSVFVRTDSFTWQICSDSNFTPGAGAEVNVSDL